MRNIMFHIMFLNFFEVTALKILMMSQNALVTVKQRKNAIWNAVVNETLVVMICKILVLDIFKTWICNRLKTKVITKNKIVQVQSIT